jgi:hypothetical protein
MQIQPKYCTRWIRQSETPYVTECWHASKAYGTCRHERLLYVVRQFVRKYPEYDGRTTAVYKDICGLLENGT